MKESVFTPLVRFMEHVPKVDDPDLMLLRVSRFGSSLLNKPLPIAQAFEQKATSEVLDIAHIMDGETARQRMSSVCTDFTA